MPTFIHDEVIFEWVGDHVTPFTKEETMDLCMARFEGEHPDVGQYMRRDRGMTVSGEMNIRVLRPVVDCQSNRLGPLESAELESVANILKLAVEAGMLPTHGSARPFGLKMLASSTRDGAEDLLAGQYHKIRIDTECHDIGRAGVRMFIRLRRFNYTLTLAYNIAPMENP